MPRIPQSAGEVVEIWADPEGQAKSSASRLPTVIHIQDAHGIYSAQKNAASVLESLFPEDPRENLLVCVEGAWEEVDTRWLSAFPDESVRKTVAESLLAQGDITGEEYLSILEPGRLFIVGVEDRKVYEANLKARRMVDRERALILGRLGALDRRLQALKERTYGEPLLALDAAAEKYADGQMHLGEYVSTLRRFSPSSWSPEKFPNVAAFLSLQKMEESLPFEAVEQERDAFVKDLSRRLDGPALNRLVQAGLDLKGGKISAQAFYEGLVRMAQVSGTSVPRLEAYLGYLKKFRDVDVGRIDGELTRFEREAVLGAVKAAPAAERLARAAWDLRVQKKLWNENLTPQEWETYASALEQGRKSSVGLEILEGFIAGEENRQGRPPVPAEAGDRIHLPQMAFLQTAFYKLALKRNAAIVEKTLAAAERAGRDKVVLITGGFHTPGLTQAFRQAGVPYAVIRPRVDLEDIKERLVKSRPAGFEEALKAVAAALRELSSFVGTRAQSFAVHGLVTSAAAAMMQNADGFGRLMRDYAGRLEARRVRADRLAMTPPLVGSDGKTYILGSYRGHGSARFLSVMEDGRVSTLYQMDDIRTRLLKEGLTFRVQRFPETSSPVRVFHPRDTREEWKFSGIKAVETGGAMRFEDSGEVLPGRKGRREAAGRSPGGSFMGQLYGRRGDTQLFLGAVRDRIVEEARGRFVEFTDESGRILYTKDGRPARVRLVYSEAGPLAPQAIRSLRLRMRQVRAFHEGFADNLRPLLRRKNILEVMEDNPYVFGFGGSSGALYLTRSIVKDPVALFHEAAESYFHSDAYLDWVEAAYRDRPNALARALRSKHRLPDAPARPDNWRDLVRGNAILFIEQRPVMIHVHTVFRGLGRDAREALEELAAQGYDTGSAAPGELIARLRPLVAGRRGRPLTVDEELLLRFNWASGQRTPGGLASGIQERIFGADANEALSESLNIRPGVQAVKPQALRPAAPATAGIFHRIWTNASGRMRRWSVAQLTVKPVAPAADRNPPKKLYDEHIRPLVNLDFEDLGLAAQQVLRRRNVTDEVVSRLKKLVEESRSPSDDPQVVRAWTDGIFQELDLGLRRRIFSQLEKDLRAALTQDFSDREAVDRLREALRIQFYTKEEVDGMLLQVAGPLGESREVEGVLSKLTLTLAGTTVAAGAKLPFDKLPLEARKKAYEQVFQEMRRRFHMEFSDDFKDRIKRKEKYADALADLKSELTARILDAGDAREALAHLSRALWLDRHPSWVSPADEGRLRPSGFSRLRLRVRLWLDPYIRWLRAGRFNKTYGMTTNQELWRAYVVLQAAALESE
ncbi:MAG: hypothetical protein ACT4O3_09425, partial [Elusimicrobiota bacterium]